MLLLIEMYRLKCGNHVNEVFELIFIRIT